MWTACVKAAVHPVRNGLFPGDIHFLLLAGHGLPVSSTHRYRYRSRQWITTFSASQEMKKKFFRFSVLHKYQISFFFPVARIAFGWSRDSPSRSHRSCWRVISLASDGERGHWKRPSPSSLLCIRTHPSRSWYRAFSLLVLRPQNRNTDLEYGSSW